MRVPAHRSLLLAALLLVAAAPGRPEEPVPSSGAVQAVVRLPSHGGSATVIYTAPGRTYLLSCAHAFQGADRDLPIRIDGPAAPRGTPRVVCVDARLDLALLEVADGPVAFCAPAAGPGYRPSSNLLSVGYDDMKVPATRRHATILRTDGDVTWTREPPWHGRSGGALLDLDTGQLIGVVSGYVHPRNGPGVYASQHAIARFLERCGWKSPSGSATPDAGASRIRQPFQLTSPCPT